MQPGSVYRTAYRLTLMSLLFMGYAQRNYWRMSNLYNSHLCHVTLESWCSYKGGKKQYRVAFHPRPVSCERKTSVLHQIKNQISSRQSKEYNLRFVYSAVWLTVCIMLSAGLSACDFWASIISLFAHDEPFGIHHEWGWVLSVLKKKKKKKKKLRPATYSVVIFKCQMVKYITVRLKHVEQNSSGGLHFLIQQLSQRFSDVRKNNINF